LFRFSNDIPVQSETVPLLSVYFLACMIYSLCGMIWFAAYNNLKDEISLPETIQKILVKYIARLFSSKKTRNQLVRTFTAKYKLAKKNKDDELEVPINKTENPEILKDKDYHLLVLLVLNRLVMFIFTFYLALFNLFIFFFYPKFQ
jgi:hypothetical protein